MTIAVVPFAFFFVFGKISRTNSENLSDSRILTKHFRNNWRLDFKNTALKRIKYENIVPVKRGCFWGSHEMCGLDKTNKLHACHSIMNLGSLD